MPNVALVHDPKLNILLMKKATICHLARKKMHLVSDRTYDIAAKSRNIAKKKKCISHTEFTLLMTCLVWPRVWRRDAFLTLFGQVFDIKHMGEHPHGRRGVNFSPLGGVGVGLVGFFTTRGGGGVGGGRVTEKTDKKAKLAINKKKLIFSMKCSFTLPKEEHTSYFINAVAGGKPFLKCMSKK